LKEEASAHTISHRDKIRQLLLGARFARQVLQKCCRVLRPSKGSSYRSGRLPDWLKMKNPEAPAVKREAEEHWGRR